MGDAIIRYDRLYTRDEAIILFQGTADEAASLESALRGASNSNRGIEFLRPLPGKPNAIEDKLNFYSVSSQNLPPGQKIKMYTISLEQATTDAWAKRAYRIFLFELNEMVLEQISGVDIFNSLPVLIEADTLELAGEKWKSKKEDLKKFQGRTSLRDNEISIYLEGFQNLAENVKPPKYVFEFTK